MAQPAPAPKTAFVDLIHSDDVDIVAARGELDVSNAGELGAALNALIDDRAGDALVDLRAVDFMDSSGTHHLLNAHRRLTRQGRHFGVICSPGQVHRMLKALRLIHTLRVTVEDAPETIT
jgi:anti-anti-sigma factor